MYNKILVTGGCGYKGSRLIPLLIQEGYKVICIDNMWFGNFLDPNPNLEVINKDLRNLTEEDLDGVESIIHLASVSNDPCSDLNPKLSWEIGPLTSMKIAELAIKNNVKNFIYASSGSVYGVKQEEKVTEDLSLEPISDYNKSKMVTERVLQSFSKDINLKIVRPGTVCGFSNRMRLDLTVNMLTIQALTKKEITILGGNQVRPNIFIDDICNLYIFLLKNPNLNGIFNANNSNYSINEIAEKIIKKTNAQKKVKPSNDPRSYKLSSEKITSLGFEFKYDIDYAIDQLIEKFNNKKIIDQDMNYNLKWMIRNKYE